jgi:hypothetical protein
MLALRHNEIDRAHRAFDFVVGNAAAGCSSIWVSDRNGGDELLRVGVLRIFEDSRTRPISTISPRYMTATRWLTRSTTAMS